MSIIVQKYGGSSMADVSCIRNVAKRVVQTVTEGNQVVVTVSAMANATNDLLGLAHAVSDNPGRRELDLLISVGERVSMTLLAMAIQDLGVNAASFTGSQSGIITDERHSSARVVAVRPHRIQRALGEGKVAIVAGFQGVSREKEVTTLGRGGSDTTAVVLTAALGAQYCEICSDVDGVYSADPRVVPDAHRLKALPLAGALAMAHCGAKVLLSDALAYAQEHNVVLHANATNQPSGSGTRLPPGDVPDKVIAVTSDDQLWCYRVHDSVPSAQLSALQGMIRAWIPGPKGLDVLVDRRNIHDTVQWPSSWELVGPVATVSAIGRDAVTDPAVVAAACSATPNRIRWWATESAWTAMVTPEHADETQRHLHAELIGDGHR